jgi:hypothetical protein
MSQFFQAAFPVCGLVPGEDALALRQQCSCSGWGVSGGVRVRSLGVSGCAVQGGGGARERVRKLGCQQLGLDAESGGGHVMPLRAYGFCRAVLWTRPGRDLPTLHAPQRLNAVSTCRDNST